MPNTNRPEDLRCDGDCNIGRALIQAGVCIFCNLGSCGLCGGVVTEAECAVSRAECPTPQPNEVYCPVCLAAIKGDGVDSDGVPEAVGEEVTERTVRLESDPTIVESGFAWAEKLDAREAA